MKIAIFTKLVKICKQPNSPQTVKEKPIENSTGPRQTPPELKLTNCQLFYSQHRDPIPHMVK